MLQTLKILGGHFDLEKKKSDLANLESELNDPSIWESATKANNITKEISTLKKEITTYDDIIISANNMLDVISMLKEENDKELFTSLLSEYDELFNKYKEFEVASLLNEEFDNNNCYLEIHPGAGGTEAQDWADMLLRMYTMFCEKNNFKYSIIDKQMGEEAGIKSVLIYIVGDFAYGYLKNEIGVHRLVRLSPFNADHKRQTSFAAVNVIPEFNNIVDIEINPSDLRVDVYRSSGNGGQGVNTTDSAVRITHIPSGIVVTVQNERSQLKNKEIALNILKSKLKKIELDKRNEEINNLKGSADINFGSQIRNYVLEPYSLVKDVRSGYETSNPDKVLSGEILPIIESVLRMKR